MKTARTAIFLLVVCLVFSVAAAEQTEPTELTITQFLTETGFVPLSGHAWGDTVDETLPTF